MDEGEAMISPEQLWIAIRAEYMGVGLTDWQVGALALAGLVCGWWSDKHAAAKRREANRRWWARWNLGAKAAWLIKRDREAIAEEARLL